MQISKIQVLIKNVVLLKSKNKGKITTIKVKNRNFYVSQERLTKFALIKYFLNYGIMRE